MSDHPMNHFPRPYFVASECGNDPCADQWCPYTHGKGWAIDGVEGLFKTPDDAVAALASSPVQP